MTSEMVAEVSEALTSLVLAAFAALRSEPSLPLPAFYALPPSCMKRMLHWPRYRPADEYDLNLAARSSRVLTCECYQGGDVHGTCKNVVPRGSASLEPPQASGTGQIRRTAWVQMRSGCFCWPWMKRPAKSHRKMNANIISYPLKDTAQYPHRQPMIMTHKYSRPDWERTAQCHLEGELAAAM